jgi:hypothetical protein
MAERDILDKELIVPVMFRVKSANYKTIVKRESNDIDGLGYKSWLTGVVPEVTFSVLPFGLTRPIEIGELVFNGFCNIEAGDCIRAYINKTEGKKEKGIMQGFYVERNFKVTETVSKLEKLGKDGELLSTFEGLDNLD